MKQRNIREIDSGQIYTHLPNDYGVTAGFHTLCGLCDVPDRISETADDVTCGTCLLVFRHVLKIAFERGVIRSMPRDTTLERAKNGPGDDQ